MIASLGMASTSPVPPIPMVDSNLTATAPLPVSYGVGLVLKALLGIEISG
ncbi:Uncharacterised protein [Segatella copri]|nr:Uncharacterised protein [Segatella copri]